MLVRSQLLEASLVGRAQTVRHFPPSHLVVNDEERDILEAWHIHGVCSFETWDCRTPTQGPGEA